MKITVYDKPNCVQCSQTKKYLETHGIQYETASIENSPELLPLIEEKGYASAPIVIFNDSSWSGFRLERLKNAVTLIKGATHHQPVETPKTDQPAPTPERKDHAESVRNYYRRQGASTERAIITATLEQMQAKWESNSLYESAWAMKAALSEIEKPESSLVLDELKEQTWTKAWDQAVEYQKNLIVDTMMRELIRVSDNHTYDAKGVLSKLIDRIMNDKHD